MDIFDADFISDQNQLLRETLNDDYDALGRMLARRDIDIDSVTAAAEQFSIAIPSWGVGTGGTRFARFPGRAEPRNLLEKLEDCAAIQTLTRATPEV